MVEKFCLKQLRIPGKILAMELSQKQSFIVLLNILFRGNYSQLFCRMPPPKPLCNFVTIIGNFFSTHNFVEHLRTAFLSLLSSSPDGNYMFKVNHRNTRTRCEICSKLTTKTPGVFIVNFEY